MSLKSILLTNSVGLLLLLCILFGYSTKKTPLSPSSEYLRIEASYAEESLNRYSTCELERMSLAAEEITRWHALLHRTRSNILTEILKGEREFSSRTHYPKGEVCDVQHHSQYYYHAHREGEHGHFHLFLHPKGMPKNCSPLFTDPDDKEKKEYTHLFAISIDKFGNPIQFFTVNQWVTGGNWYKAEDIAMMVKNFHIGHTQPSWVLNQWINAILILFYPQIVALLEKRDEMVEEWKERYLNSNPLEDRGLEVITSIPISTENQIDRIQDILEKRCVMQH